MLSVILQLGGLANLIQGITAAAISDSAFDPDTVKSKFDF
jgi:hypothetical protein